MMINATARGRDQLKQWERAKPDNAFTGDANLQRVLQMYMGDDAFQQSHDNLQQLGEAVANELDELAKIEDRIGNHPRLERWSGVGERVEAIEFHPNHDRAGEIIWRSEIMAMQASAGRTVEQMGLYYLLGQNGEAGHLCSLACTSGLIRALQQAGDHDVQARFLPPLLDPDYQTMQHGAQFLTEVQGGSDVGANTVQATQNTDGTWRINGEKWFCSNINAQQFLMTARATDAAGTRGLGLFVVPRTLDDGSTNGFYIRRLKDKLGTRTLASAELDFKDAVAYNVGPVEEGFKTVVALVLNTSRLMNAVACAGIIRRATVEAQQYACHREAFGQPIANYPMVQEAISDLVSTTHAATASSFYLASLVDRIEQGDTSPALQGTYRLLVNANKYITSIQGTNMVHRAIEVLGGNGAIESFSILPRLYRDMVVLESWEGTHNVLCLQVLRDMARYQIHEPFFADLRDKIAAITAPTLIPYADIVAASVDRLAKLAQKLLGDERALQTHARHLVDRLSVTAQAAYLLYEAQWELDRQLQTPKPDAAAHFILTQVARDYDPVDDEHYAPRIERLMMS